MRINRSPQPVPSLPGGWVEAAPFRAHVRHTLDVAGVPWPAFAVHSGVSLPALRALLFGRAGRALTRLEPGTAARLLRVDATDLAGLRHRHVPADATAGRLRSLIAAGVDPLRLAGWADLVPSELARLVDGEAPSCTRLTECLVVAAGRQLASAPIASRAA